MKKNAAQSHGQLRIGQMASNRVPMATDFFLFFESDEFDELILL